MLTEEEQNQSRYKYKNFYTKFIPKLPITDEDEVAVKCPFHNDSHPSMHINLRTGLWNCKTCDSGQNGSGGDPAAWLVEWLDLPLSEAIKAQNKYVETGDIGFPMDRTIADNLHEELGKHITPKKLFQTKRGFTDNTLDKFNIGYEEGLQRYTIPVYSLRGDLINIRRYKMGAKKAKFINTKNAYTKSYLWPLDEDFINSTWTVIFEGETDAALARQLGIPSITQTGGAGQWPRKGSMNHYFRDKKVFICYDGDKAGQDGAHKIALDLRDVASEVRICSYPIAQIDFTDYIMEHNKSREDFYEEVLVKSEVFVPNVEKDLKQLEGDNVASIDAIPTTLSEATYDPAFNNVGIELDAMVVGRSGSIYTAPKTVTIFADNYDPEQVPGHQCLIRSLTAEQLAVGYDVTFPITRDILTFVGVGDEKRLELIKKMLGIPSKLYMYRIVEKEAYNVEQLFLGPSVEKFSRDISDDSVDTQTAYHVYSGARETVMSNKVYKLEGLRTANPKDSSVAFIIHKAKPVREEMDSFKPTPEELEELKIFQPAEGESVKDKLYHIATDLEYFTRIWDRKNLIIAYDLVYHSVLRFHLDNKMLGRGWLELLVVGDPRTGKSETAEYMADYYQSGDMIEVENTRLTGLTGTVQQLGGDQWSITWGKFPQNDRKLLILDEVSGLTKDDFGAMSSMRSRGIVEINKAKIGQAYARTRSIWISNPRVNNGAKHMKDFPYGAKAIIDLVGRSEDIARFDFAMGVGRDEVDESIINKDTSSLPNKPQTYTPELCQRLIMWAWSRNAKGYLTPENDKVEFTEDARRLLLVKASEMGRAYDGSSLSIVERNSMKVKLARLSVACATRLFSTDETFEKVIVRTEHILFIVDFLNELYANTTLGYRAMATDEQRRHLVTSNQQESIFRFIFLNPDTMDLIDQIKGNITTKVLEESLNMDQEEAKSIISQMMKLELLYVATAGGGTQYRVTHKWNEQLREYRSRTEEEIKKIIKLR